MRRILLTYILLSVIGLLNIQAQVATNTLNQDGTMRDQYGNQIDPATQPDNLDSTHVDIQSLPPKLYMWTISETLGERTIIPADTASLNFQSTNLVEGMQGHYNYLGNLGAPRQSRLFFERRNDYPTIFIAPLSFFYFRPDQFKFTNSNVPFTNLTYYKAGSRINGEDRFKSYFSVNANKRLAFGFNIDYLYGRGYYSNQATSHFNAGIFASYIGEKYQMHAAYNNFFFKMNENGGITDDRYITRPEEMEDVGGNQYIPVRLEETSNRNHDFFVYLTHRYRLGFHREVTKIEETDPVARRKAERDSTAIPKDTLIVEEFVPVTSFIHTFKIERSNHRFRSGSEPTGADAIYDNTYLQEGFSRDSTLALSVKNVLGISLLEGFNKYAKAGLTAYISHKFSRYTLMNMDTTIANPRPVHYDEQEVFVGGELSKRQGKLLHYNVNGEIGLAGEAIGQFKVNGDIDLNFRLGKDTVNFYARGHVSNLLPSFYMRHYHSNHFTWDNDDMKKEFRTGVEGELNIDRWGTNLRAGMENIKNYTYFDQNALPAQHSGSVQVLSATLNQNFKLGIFHLDNEITWQKTSNASILPLPDFSLYHNFYLLTKLVKVLTVQLGADVRYFTSYNAPAYMPATQQFHLQPEDDQVKIGGYPIVNAYLNIHLKRTRIFVMMYHVNAGMGNRQSFLVPHYPINPRLLKIGISWNFYD
ncbi:MAG TPA: putative porin [Candidatus Bacteroides avicola]|uniref:Porin n=1 Tax=Candidatus Bacteroides avicola TaxID=2838468 RepID=A0A9D2KW21_9BACE|nr:putative porin [Candidatus Bacteroides avicola]